MVSQAQRRRLERLERNQPSRDYGARPGPAISPAKLRETLKMLIESGALDDAPGTSALADQLQALLTTAPAQDSGE